MSEIHLLHNKRIISLLWILLYLTLFTAESTAEYPRRDAIVEAVQNVSPAVVNISSEYEVHIQNNPFSSFGMTPGFDSFFKDFFDFNYNQDIKRSNLGSGIIIDGKRKLVLTNAHVVTKSANITITLKDEREFKAILIGADPDSDLAVLKIESDTFLPDIEMGRSDDLMIGETVIAIGNPFGFQNTVTTGVISSTNRSIKTEERIFHNFIQTDASINPGNSGGPLLNINGQLIGINTAIYANAQGIGFAIPIDKAKRIVSDLIKYGEVIPAWTGIIIQNIDKHLAQYLNIPDDMGVVVKEIEPKSPAQRSGIQEGDIIISLNDQKVMTSEDFSAIMKGVAADESITIKILRNKIIKSFSIQTLIFPIENAIPLAYQLLGIKVQNITVPMNSFHKNRSTKGVEIVDLNTGSYLYKIGAAPGDVILQINEHKIDNLNDFKKAIIKYRTKSSMVILLMRGGSGYYITITL
jgi:serine protease Do